MIIYDNIFRKYGLSPTQQEILKIVGPNKTVLEIGSSTGYMTRAFLEQSCTVDIVEADSKAVLKIPKKARKIINKSIEDKDIFGLLNKDYQFIIMADVLEHLVKPEQVLKQLQKIASPATKLIISLPNIACWAMRKQLFFKGDFEYQDSGLLDRTHLHFYTVKSLQKFLLDNGWKTEQLKGTITRLPFEGFISKVPLMGWIFKKIFYQGLVNKFKNLAYYHLLIVASK
ncbi:class I SAM-dependent methyltransferase [Candidatus Daviesbacteria bacterium]|nr:class I SAM-dependent methyltransferase [Candidatus Daviesbacteria bacterium]